MASPSASPSLPYATYRFRNIPSSFGEADFKSVVSLHGGREVIVGFSISSDIYATHASEQVGTLTFNTVPQVIKDLNLSEDGSATVPIPRDRAGHAHVASSQDQAALVVDSHFSGFTPLNTCAGADESMIEYVKSPDSNQ